MRRVSVSGEIRARGTASFFLRGANYSARAFSMDGGALTPADTQWTRHEYHVVISRTARVVDMFAQLRGVGEIEVRGLELSVEDLPAASTALASDAKRELDSAMMIVRQSSFWRDTVSWASVEADVRAIAAGAQSPAETYPAIRELLSRLGDHHSFLMPAQQSTQWQNGTLAKNPLPTVKSFAGGVGYVSVPAYSGGDAGGIREYAEGAHKLLVQTAPAVSCGWVLDLRQNGGGNMWPMLAGLKPFVGNGGLGSFSGPNGGGAQWIAGQNVAAEAPRHLAPLESSTVAVLIGPRTASSGEAVAVAFHGRPQTRFFGQPTAGLANANGTMRLPDGALMMVMTAVDVDRNGQKFGEKVMPDETIAPAAGGQIDSPDDPAVAAAIRWLHAQSGCR
jgi:hypothetical protein